MAVSETEREEQGVIYGKLIALEGDTEMLATQLQLLPPSQKFLVIPSMPEIFSDKEDFDPRSYVRTVHLAFKDRTERAQAFLRDGTSAHPRLVFMNGGSVSARRRCISRICQDTDGDVGAAEDVFKEIAQDGVAGLMRDMSEQERQTERDAIDGEEEQVDEEEAESPHSKFMKAAESLKRETTSPQTDVTEEGLVSSPAHKLGATQNTEDVPTQGIFTTQHGGEIVRTILTGPSRPATFMDQKRGTFGSQYEEEYDPYAFADVASPGDGSLMSGGPPTPIVIYGEACLVDMASASPTKPRRAASFDTGRFYPSNSRFLEPPSSPGSALKHTTSAYNLRRPRTSEGMQARADGFPKLPRTTFLKASETTIKRSPTSAGSLNSSSTSLLVPAPRIFVDPGTDAKDAMGDTSKTGDSPWESEIFTPVFPVVEDFILQLFDGKPDEILESVIRTSKDGSYPAISQSIPSSPLSEGYDSSTSPLSGSCLRHAYGQPAEPCSNRRSKFTTLFQLSCGQ
jgi:hypothetical protein